jgi:hypothetical protein
MNEIYTVFCGCCGLSDIVKVDKGVFKFRCRKRGDGETPEELGYEENGNFGCEDFELDL